ncbi:methyltransferase family protein [Orrella sp. 11846]|uniref:methyltransferase family protein n=1 Tax=Orrella sp. 11846 TaxID=3409913 RepID=UPI003B5BD575
MGIVLVVLQITLIFVLAILASLHSLSQTPGVTGVVLLIISAIIGIWAITANRPGNFSVLPLPKQHAQLITHGPYRWIRHPMYTSVLLFGLACASVLGTPLGVSLWIALVITLSLKARLEEQYLLQSFEAYGQYMQRTGRFLPKLI